MDRLLHKERTDFYNESARPGELPNGAIVAQGKTAYLVNTSRLCR
jgi:hypothetical protein